MLCVGEGKKCFGLWVDMDVLLMQEWSGKLWVSQVEGCFYGCGYDGYIIMLFYVVEYLVCIWQFIGMLQLIFQFVEELLYGGWVMVEDGLFDQFFCDVIFGLYNMLGQLLGKIGLCDGVMMVFFDMLYIEVKGVGGYGVVLEYMVDVMLVVCYIIFVLQFIVLCNIILFELVVVIVGSIQVGYVFNIINDYVLMKFMVCIFNEQVCEIVLQWIYDIVVVQVESFNVIVMLIYVNGSLVLCNDLVMNVMVWEVVIVLFGVEQVGEVKLFMGSEDFVFMLEQYLYGSYFIIGVGDELDCCMVYNLGYDFNDVLLLIGVVLWCGLMECYLC